MCFGDVLVSLRRQGVSATPTQVRWAITSGKVSRPPLDGSLRFDFGADHLAELCGYFENRRAGRELQVDKA